MGSGPDAALLGGEAGGAGRSQRGCVRLHAFSGEAMQRGFSDLASLMDRRGEQIAVDVSAAPAMRTRVVRATERLVPMKRHWPQRRESSSPADKSKTTPQPK